MFNWFKSLIGLRRPRPLDAASERIRQAEVRLQEQWSKARCQLLETAAESLRESSLFAFDNLVDPREPLYDNEGFWLPLGSGEAIPPNIDNRKRGEVLPVYLTEYQLKVIRDQSRKQLAYNEFAINAIENRASYIVGTGFTYKVVRKNTQPGKPSGNDRLCKMAQDVLDRFRAACDWGELEQEIVVRNDTDGETFLQWFPQPSGGVAVRVVEPEWVRSPSGSVEPHCSFGIETDPQDIEDRRGYHVVADPTISLETEFVPADEILHLKLNTKRNSKRGLPTLLPVRKNLERAEKLLRNMSTLAQIQATFALIRKHKNYSGGAISAFQGQQADVTFTAPLTQKTNTFQQYLPGSIIDTGDGTEYEFPAAGIAASEYVNILQAELRAVAARLCMPEYMLTADASNANYASTLVAEAPAVKHFERLQDFYARKFGKGCYRPGPHCGAMWRVLEVAVRMGKLPRQVLTDCELQVEGPSLTVRDRTQETNRYKVMNEAGLLSKRQWSSYEGVDYDKEQAAIQTEPKAEELGGGHDGMFGQQGDDDSGGSEDDFPFDLGEACVPNRQGNRFHDDKTGRPCRKGGSSEPGHGSHEHHVTVDYAKRHVEAVKANLTPDKVVALADTLSRLTSKELKQLKQEMGLKLDKASWRKKGAMAAKIADAATQRITEDEGFQRKARAERLPWKEVRGYAEMYRETANQTIDAINRCVAEAREMYRNHTGGALTRRLKAFDGGDHASIKAFDVIARELAGRYPEILGAHGYSHHAGYDPDAEQASERLYELIAAGRQPRITRQAAYEHTFTTLIDERDRKSAEVPF